MDGISEVSELIYVMLKGDDGKFLRQLTDLIFGQFLTDAISFFDVSDSKELRLYYEFLAARMAAFIIKWVPEKSLTEDEATALLAEILIQISTRIPMHLEKQKRKKE